MPPVIVTLVPPAAGPLDGEIEVTVGAEHAVTTARASRVEPAMSATSAMPSTAKERIKVTRPKSITASPLASPYSRMADRGLSY